MRKDFGAVRLDDFIQDLARTAGHIQKKAFHHTYSWRSKTGKGDIVTEIDEACERLILDRITREFPNYPILSEESGAFGVEEDMPVWVIDPLDGTRNYKMGIPFFCTSIGLVRKGVPEIGAIYDPIHDEMFFAERGKGAFVNGERISIGCEDSLEDAIVSISWVKQKVNRHTFLNFIDELSHQTSYFRRFGSAALVTAYVACGRVDAYMQGGLNPWDMAAAVLLIEEAGGMITDFQGKPIDIRNKDIEVVTANPKLHSILLEKVIRRDKW